MKETLAPTALAVLAGGAGLAILGIAFFGLDWVGNQLDLPPEAKGWVIAGGMGGLGTLCLYLGAKTRN